MLQHRHSLPTCVKQNALNHTLQFPLAAKAVNEAFYVDDGITGADSIEETITLQHELHSLFSLAGFLLRKWNSSESTVLDQIDSELTLWGLHYFAANLTL